MRTHFDKTADYFVEVVRRGILITGVRLRKSTKPFKPGIRQTVELLTSTALPYPEAVKVQVAYKRAHADEMQAPNRSLRRYLHEGQLFTVRQFPVEHFP